MHRMKNPSFVRRGDIYIANLPEGTGCEQQGRHPAVIMQNDMGNRYSPTVQVIPLTSKFKNLLPTHVMIFGEKSGLWKASIALAEQLGTIDKKRLIRWIGRVEPEKMKQLDDAIHIQLGLK